MAVMKWIKLGNYGTKIHKNHLIPVAFIFVVLYNNFVAYLLYITTNIYARIKLGKVYEKEERRVCSNYRGGYR